MSVALHFRLFYIRLWSIEKFGEVPLFGKQRFQFQSAEKVKKWKTAKRIFGTLRK